MAKRRSRKRTDAAPRPNATDATMRNVRAGVRRVKELAEHITLIETDLLGRVQALEQTVAAHERRINGLNLQDHGPDPEVPEERET